MRYRGNFVKKKIFITILIAILSMTINIKVYAAYKQILNYG